MAFSSINPTNPRTHLWNFREKISRIDDFEKRPFWKIGHFEFFSSKKNFFCFILMKISLNLYGRMDGSKFWWFPWFPENSLLCAILCYTVYMNLWSEKFKLEGFLIIFVLTLLSNSICSKQAPKPFWNIDKPNEEMVRTRAAHCFLLRNYRKATLRWQLTGIITFYARS